MIYSVDQFGVIRDSNNVVVPQVESEVAYQLYVTWLQSGNTLCNIVDEPGTSLAGYKPYGVDIVGVEFLPYSSSSNVNGYPTDWPKQARYVLSENEETLTSWVRVSQEAYDAHVSDGTRLQGYLNASLHAVRSKILRINSIIDDSFTYLRPEKLDFRRHLKNGVYLNKIVTMLDNGRPDYCLYDYEGELYARVRFEFEVNPYNLLVSKKSYLGYHNLNGDITVEYILTEEKNDLNSLYGLQKAVKERYSARKYIFDEIKSYVNVILLMNFSSTMTYEEILMQGSLFWRDYSTAIDSWCNIGGTSIMTDKLNADTVYAFLDLPVNAQGVTLRQWIIHRITY